MTGFFEHCSDLGWEHLSSRVERLGRHVRNPLSIPVLIYEYQLQVFSKSLYTADDLTRAVMMKIGLWEPPASSIDNYTTFPIPLDYDKAHGNLVFAYKSCTTHSGDFCENFGEDLEIAFSKLATWFEDRGNSHLAADLLDVKDLFSHLRSLGRSVKRKRLQVIQDIDMQLKVVHSSAGGALQA